MANVRLIRQRLSDYNTAINRANTRYQSDYDAYATEVEAWNKIAKATPYVIAKDDGSTSVQLSDGQLLMLDGMPHDQYAAVTPGQYYNGVTAVQPNLVWPGSTGYETVYNYSFGKYPAKAGQLPVEPTMAATPREPSLSNRDIKTLQAPPTNAAGVEMDRAKGYTGVSELVAENEDRARVSAFSSAFDDPNNPQALKDRGILAKTLAGKL